MPQRALVDGYLERLKADKSINGLAVILADIDAEPGPTTTTQWLQLNAIARVAEVLMEKELSAIPRLYREYP